jgi:uncharacterized protein (TIGR03066 family)
MRVLKLALTACLVLALSACSGDTKKDKDGKGKDGKNGKPAGEKSNAEKIIGTWEVVKSEEAPPGAIMEFTKDGKMKMTAKIMGKEQTMEATYKVDGDKITVTMKAGGKEKTETATIKTLTDTKLVTEDEKKKIDEFKKK